MAINPLKAFLFLTGGAGAAVGGAYVTGLVDMLNAPVPGIEAKAPEQPKSAALAPQPEPAAPAEPAKPAESGLALPSFDILRVEPDGSVVIAGKAAAGSEVDVVVDGVVVAKGKADAGGDFAIVLEKPLAPGDHQIVLIARAEAGEPLQSAETATVSIPDTPGGEVLAMIEEPGKASEIVTMPKPADAPAAEPAKPAEAVTAPADPAKPAAPEPAKPAVLAVAIKAVEIEGAKIFVAGTGQPGYAARIYVDDLLLGEAPVQPDGGFVVEAVRELAVGAHAVRADLVGLKDGAVVARSQVPFEREPG
ncbi:MAG: Ig-like domain-containing protein, partial [Rhizobiaceae bacterium]